MLVLLTYYGLLLFIFHFFLPSACIARGVQLSQAAFPKSLRKVTLGSVPGAPCNQPPSQQLILSFPNLIHTTSFLLSLGAHINSIPTPSLQSKQPSLHQLHISPGSSCLAPILCFKNILLRCSFSSSQVFGKEEMTGPQKYPEQFLKNAVRSWGVGEGQCVE